MVLIFFNLIPLHDLVNEFPKKNDFFLNQWINGITPSVETEFVLIK